MNYYSFHIADFALHTMHLTLEEEAVYRRLLDFYYDTESPIPEKTERVIRRLRLVKYEETVSFILEEFFVLQDDGWHNLRADSEIDAYNKKAETAKANGRKGGRPKKNKGLQTSKPKKTQPVNSANPEKTESKANQEPRTSNQEPIIKTSLPLGDIAKAFNEKIGEDKTNCVGLIRGLTGKRESHLKARIREDDKRRDLSWWNKYFDLVGSSGFLMGCGSPDPDTGRVWACDFDWIINPTNMIRILEGRYHNG